MYKETFKTRNGDIVIENNDIALTDDIDELRQNLEHRYSINKEEWFLNTELGLSYKDIVGKGVLDAEINIAVRECGFQDERVSRIENIEIEREKRKAHIKFDIVDLYGEELSEEVEV